MKFKAIHLRSNPEDEREVRSHNDISQLEKFGIECYERTNSVYTGFPPVPREAPDRPFILTPAHYGCYSAHKSAILDHLVPSVDALLLFECDAVFAVSVEEFAQRVEQAWEACMRGDLDVFTFGPKHNGQIIDRVGTKVIVTTQFIETHAYMVPLKSLSYFQEVFSRPWDALDYVYTIYMYDQDKRRIGTFADRAVAVQANGVSLITGETKTSEEHWRYKEYD